MIKIVFSCAFALCFYVTAQAQNDFKLDGKMDQGERLIDEFREQLKVNTLKVKRLRERYKYIKSRFLSFKFNNPRLKIVHDSCYVNLENKVESQLVFLKKNLLDNVSLEMELNFLELGQSISEYLRIQNLELSKEDQLILLSKYEKTIESSILFLEVNNQSKRHLEIEKVVTSFLETTYCDFTPLFDIKKTEDFKVNITKYVTYYNDYFPKLSLQEIFSGTYSNVLEYIASKDVINVSNDTSWIGDSISKYYNSDNEIEVLVAIDISSSLHRNFSHPKIRNPIKIIEESINTK